MRLTRRYLMQSTIMLGIFSENVKLYAVPFQSYNSVKDFGAVGDGVTDDTVAIQKCINSKQSVYFPAGNYLISDTLIQKFSGQKFYGEGINPYNDSNHGSRIIQKNPSQSIFKSTKTGFSANSLNLTYSRVPISGCAFDIQHSGSLIDSIWIDKCWRGFAYSNNTGHNLSNSNVQNAYHSALSVSNTNDVAVNNCIFVSADLNNKSLDQKVVCPNGVVLFEQYVQAVQMTNVDILGGAKSFGVSSTAPSNININVLPAFCKFSNVYFDSSYYGADIDKCLGMTFVNCWFSNRPKDGIVIGKNFADNIKLIGCNIENCGSHGILLYNRANNILIDSCSVLNNSQIEIGKYNGIHIQGNTNYFTINNCIIQNVNYFPKTQGFGIFLETGNSQYFKIINNTLSNNLNGNIKDMSTITKQKIIRDNFPIE